MLPIRSFSRRRETWITFFDYLQYVPDAVQKCFVTFFPFNDISELKTPFLRQENPDARQSTVSTGTTSDNPLCANLPQVSYRPFARE